MKNIKKIMIILILMTISILGIVGNSLGEDAKTVKPTVSYRTHVQDIGWQDWALDGEISGTTGQGKRIEAIEIKIQAKNNTEKATSFIDYPSATTIEKGQYQIKGWEMSNTDTTIKIYINL